MAANFSYAFPTNTFTDADSDTLSFSAEQSNGSTLPSWLTIHRVLAELFGHADFRGHDFGEGNST